MTRAVRRINSRTGPGKDAAAGTLRLLAMPDFVVAHGLDDSPAAQVVGRQSFEVTLQMTFDLALGFGHEPQAGTVPEQCGERADAEGSRIPQGVEHARAAAQLLEPGFAPGEMIGFVAGRVEHEFPDFRVTREQGLGVVKRLRGHLPGVIDPHQGGGFAPVLGGKGGIRLLGIARAAPGWREGVRAGRRPEAQAGPAGRDPPQR